MRPLLEGGNVFKDADGRPLTQRIQQTDVASTVAWLEQLTGLDFTQDRDPNTNIPLRWLGSTGRTPTSGDLDLAVDANSVSKDQLKARLDQWAASHGQEPRLWTAKSGEAVHLRTPISGRPEKGYVQTDFMFMPDLAWGIFWLGGGSSNYKGVHRNVLMSSLAKASNLKASNKGIIDRATNQEITRDPAQAARLLLGKTATPADLATVENIFSFLARDPRREEKLADFREYAARENLQLPDSIQESDVGFLARLRDRIVNQGMLPLIESDAAEDGVIAEAEQAGVGGRAKGIEHLEDLVFRRGTAGVRQAMDIVQHAAEQPSTTTVKWDGKPAVIFGRKPATGEFVLTDGAGFEARGYDGLATSPDQMRQIQQARGGDREGLIQIYQRLWPMLEAALPENFRGYVKGDLLYMTQPPEVAGNYVFQPNTVEYRIPARSGLGQRIGASDVGIAMHSMYADQGDPRQPLSRVRFQEVPGLLLIEPIVSRGIELDAGLVRDIRDLVRQKGAAIDTLFNAAELRAHQITDLARLCVDYINHRIRTGNFDDLLSQFGEWLRGRVTPRKFANIIEYLKSPTSNTEGMAAAFTLFLLLHDLKMQVLQQLDRQSPGNEGWVMATPAGYAKAVNRFDFTARNMARNNP